MKQHDLTTTILSMFATQQEWKTYVTQELMPAFRARRTRVASPPPSALQLEFNEDFTTVGNERLTNKQLEWYIKKRLPLRYARDGYKRIKGQVVVWHRKYGFIKYNMPIRLTKL